MLCALFPNFVDGAGGTGKKKSLPSQPTTGLGGVFARPQVFAIAATGDQGDGTPFWQ